MASLDAIDRVPIFTFRHTVILPLSVKEFFKQPKISTNIVPNHS